MEEIGVYRETEGYRWERGRTCRVYRTVEGRVRIVETEWSVYDCEPNRETIHEFGSLDEAAEAGFVDLLYNMYITHNGKDVEVWREWWANS